FTLLQGCRDDVGVLLRRRPPRGATHRDDVAHRERERDGNVLGHDGAPAGRFLHRQLAQFGLPDVHAARVGLERARTHAEEGRFTCAVGADDRGHRPGREAQGHIIEDGPVPDEHARAGYSQHHWPPIPWPRRVRRSSSRNSGPPTTAVKMPIGRSAKGTTVRAAMSARLSRTAPPRADSGMRNRCEGPIARRSAWGTMSPTNAMTPENATATPVRRQTSRIAMTRRASTCTPEVEAAESPSAS